MTLQASLPCSAVNVPDDFFYMAGFEVTLYGRIWVSAEVLVSGVVNLSSCSSNIETTTSQKLANDPELRDKIVSKAQGDFKDTQEKLKKLNDQIAELEKENAREVHSSVEELKQLTFMIQRLNEELSHRLPSRNNHAPKSGKGK